MSLVRVVIICLASTHTALVSSPSSLAVLHFLPGGLSSQSIDLPPASHWPSLAATGTLTGFLWRKRNKENRPLRKRPARFLLLCGLCKSYCHAQRAARWLGRLDAGGARAGPHASARRAPAHPQDRPPSKPRSPNMMTASRHATGCATAGRLQAGTLLAEPAQGRAVVAGDRTRLRRPLHIRHVQGHIRQPAAPVRAGPLAQRKCLLPRAERRPVRHQVMVSRGEGHTASDPALFDGGVRLAVRRRPARCLDACIVRRPSPLPLSVHSTRAAGNSTSRARSPRRRRSSWRASLAGRRVRASTTRGT